MGSGNAAPLVVRSSAGRSAMRSHWIAAGMLVVATILSNPATASAAPANPTPFELVQPNGARFMARLVGDEWSNAVHTLDGYAIVRNDVDIWVYANKDASGQLVPTTLVVTEDSPTALRRGLRPDRLPTAPPVGVLSSVGGEAVGDRPVLVILVQFSNRTAMTTAAAWQSPILRCHQQRQASLLRLVVRERRTVPRRRSSRRGQRWRRRLADAADAASEPR